MHVAQRPSGPPPLRRRARPGWRRAALLHTALGLVCVAACAALPRDELAMLATIAGGLPWSVSLLALELSPGFAQLALLVLAGSWAANSALLWWMALRPSADTPD